MPTRLHLQLALDHCTLPEALALAERAAPVVDSIELGTPFLIREGVAALRQFKALLDGHPCALFADTKISDEGALIARICLEAGADALSVVDGASTRTLQEARTVVNEFGRQLWVDLLYHSNPIIRARALAPYVDGFIVHRPRNGFPPLLVEGLMAVEILGNTYTPIDADMSEAPVVHLEFERDVTVATTWSVPDPAAWEFAEGGLASPFSGDIE